MKVEYERSLPRRLLSYLTHAGVIPPPPVFRPAGISAITLAKNEEDWSRTSILSIMNFVDEVLIADNNSDDSTLEVLESLARSYPTKIRLVRPPKEDFVSSTNLMIKMTRFRWILRWHADFVARTSGEESIQVLVDRARRHSSLRYHCVSLSGVALDGDLEHQFEDRRDIPEPFLYTYSPWLGYYTREHWEALHMPWFYERVTWPERFYFHMRRVKSALRLLQTIYWSKWFDDRNRGGRQSLKEFVRYHATRDYNVSTVEEAAKKCALDWFQGCVPYDHDVCGDYPELLLPALADPPYKLMYSGGKLIDRIERASHLRRHEGSEGDGQY